MTKKLYSASDNNEEEITWASKSEVKRDAEKLKRLGIKLVEMGKRSLDQIPLDDDLRATIELTQKIKKKGRRRQLQLIGKMLRSRDEKPIRAGLDKLKNNCNQQTALFHKLEVLYNRLMEQGDDVLHEILNLYPDANRQQLRMMIRNARKEKATEKPPKACCQIFHYLRKITEAS